MSQVQAPETTHGDVRSAINANATDAESRISQLEIEKTITTPSDLGTPVGGFYELSDDGKYRFACGQTLDFPIKLTKINGNYTFEGVNINCLLTYNGVESMIQTANTGIVLSVNNLVFEAPNTEAITFANGNSLILHNVSLGFGCQKVATVTDTTFLTCTSFAMVLCDDGITATNIDTIRLTDTQWSNGTNLGGTAFAISGTGERVIVNNVDYRAEATEAMFDIDSGYTGAVSMVGGTFTDDGGIFFKAGSLNQTNPLVDSFGIARVPNSNVTAEVVLRNNGVLTTDIPSIDALVLANSVSWVEQNTQRISVSSDGIATSNNIENVSIRWDGGIDVEPASSVKQLIARFVKIGIENETVTFSNATNIVNEVGTSLNNGDTLIFYNTSGTLPSELRKDVVYYVVNKLTDSFQLSYTDGGAVISFTDDGTPTNAYDLASITEGSEFTEPIAANNPRTIIVKSNLPTSTGEKVGIFIQNKDDSTNVTMNSGYFRS